MSFISHATLPISDDSPWLPVTQIHCTRWLVMLRIFPLIEIFHLYTEAKWQAARRERIRWRLCSSWSRDHRHGGGMKRLSFQLFRFLLKYVSKFKPVTPWILFPACVKQDSFDSPSSQILFSSPFSVVVGSAGFSVNLLEALAFYLMSYLFNRWPLLSVEAVNPSDEICCPRQNCKLCFYL